MEKQQIEQQKGGEGTAEGKKPRGRAFTGPDDPRLRQNRVVPQMKEESGDMLELMRHVAAKGSGSDTTYEQKEYRKWLRKDQKGFMAAKAGLEKAALLAKGKKEAGPEREDGEGDEGGTERALALIEEFLEGKP